MKDDWLTIPDAPNYEINSQLICRNKKTGHILKKSVRLDGAVLYQLTSAPKVVIRSPKTLRAQAVATTLKQTYIPIPSLGGKYEINSSGTVRNAQTKCLLKKQDNAVLLFFNHQNLRRNIDELLWEVHGIIKKKRFSRTIPVAAENQHGKHFFPNMNACALFLAPKVFYTVNTVLTYLSSRKDFISDWKITYLDDDINHNDYALADAKTPTEVYK